MLRQIPRYPGKITTRDLMERLVKDGYTVSKRTVERDLMSLSQVFPLLSDEREKPFGWSWKKDAVPLDVPSLGNSEALAFRLIEQYLHGLLPGSIIRQLDPYFKMATQRLSGLNGESVPTWPDKIRVVQPAQPLIPPTIKSAVQECVGDALLYDRQLRIRYLSRGQKKTAEYVVHPLALIQRGQTAYLAACLFQYEDIRLLALHRIEHAVMLDETSKAPNGFNVDKYIASGALGWGDGGTIKLEANILNDAAGHLYETPLSNDQVISSDKEGWLRVTATVANTPQLNWWLLGFGDAVEVIRPIPLKNAIKKTIARLGKIYKIS